MELQVFLESLKDGFPAFEDFDPVTPFSQTKSGDNPLHYAVIGGNLRAVQLLIEAGADVNSPGEYGEKPLQLANDFKRTEIALALADAGAKQ